jgi:hypothetical protein
LVDVTIEQKRLQKALSAAPDALYIQLRRAWKEHHDRFVHRMKTQRLSGRPGLNAPTGTLRRGLMVIVSGHDAQSLEVKSAFTGPHAKFAHVHEEGMTITPKAGKYLWFPIRAGTAARSTNIDKWVRVTSVTIPARLGFMDTWKRMLNALYARTNKAVGMALSGGNDG